MKYKYLVLSVCALNISAAFCSIHAPQNVIEADTLTSYKKVLSLVERADTDKGKRVSLINRALKVGGQNFDNTKAEGTATNVEGIVTSILTRLYFEKSIIKLDYKDLASVVETNNEFFQTSMGVGLLYGWTLNKYKDHETPYYVGKFFSYHDHFQGLVSTSELSDVEKIFLKSRFNLGLKAVEADRWGFYFNSQLWVHSAIERVRDDAKKALVFGVDSVPNQVLSSFRDLKKQAAEAEALNKNPKHAQHLWDDKNHSAFKHNAEIITADGFTKEQNVTDNHVLSLRLSAVQQMTLQDPYYMQNVDPVVKQTILSLPENVVSGYKFMGKTLGSHLDTINESVLGLMAYNTLESNKAHYLSENWIQTTKKILKKHEKLIAAKYNAFLQAFHKKSHNEITEDDKEQMEEIRADLVVKIQQ